MSDEAMRAWLEVLAADARERPGRHALRITGLAAIGYLYPALVIGGTVGSFAALVWFAPAAFGADGVEPIVWMGLACLALWVAWSVLQACQFAVARPAGVLLEPDAAPALRALVEDVRQKMGGVPIHEIRLNLDYNAAVGQYPAHGLFGGTRNVLTLGLQLLAVHGPEHLGDVLAHEFGHLARQHGLVNRWIYRLNVTWQALRYTEAGSRSLSWWVLGWFLERYPQHLYAVTLSRRRDHENEADRAGVAVRGPGFAKTLVRANVWGDHLDRVFWPELLREAARDPVPPSDVLARLREFATRPVPIEHVRAWAGRQRAWRTSLFADHPCTRDRLAAMGAPPLLDDEAALAEAALPAPAYGALDLLAAAPLPQDKAVRIWKAESAPAWRGRHDWIKRTREALARPGTDAVQRAWSERQVELGHLAGPEARAALEEFLGRYPGHPWASYALGVRLLDDDETAGIAHIETGMAAERELVLQGLDLLLAHHRQRGNDRAGDAVRARLEKVLGERTS